MYTLNNFKDKTGNIIDITKLTNEEILKVEKENNVVFNLPPEDWICAAHNIRICSCFNKPIMEKTRTFVSKKLDNGYSYMEMTELTEEQKEINNKINKLIDPQLEKK